jgi:glycosyltransferase involved in cell wall biosynthesis
VSEGPGPRLLIVANVSWFLVSHRLPVAVAAREAGYDVHVAAAPDETSAAIEAAGLTFHPIPLRRGAAGLAADLGTLRALAALYRRLRPALVLHVTMKPVVFGGVAARLAGVPHVIGAVAGMGSMFLAAGPAARARVSLVRRLLRFGAAVPGRWFIFQNDADLAEFAAQGIARPDRAVLIRGSGVDLRRFVPAPEPTGPPVVVLPARMLRDKGVVEFVEAARRLHARGVAARCALVGGADPDNPSAIPPAQLEAWQAEGAVEWWGHRTDMPVVHAQSHVTCLPSYREGMPKALLEAAACGRPIVTTDVPGCRDCVEPGVSGLLVPARDPAALADALEALLGDPARRAAMGRAARARAEREFGIESVVAATLDLFRRCLAA